MLDLSLYIRNNCKLPGNLREQSVKTDLDRNLDFAIETKHIFAAFQAKKENWIIVYKADEILKVISLVTSLQ